MKKLVMLVVVAVAVAIVGSAFALDLPGVGSTGNTNADSLKNQGANMGAKAAINSKLKNMKCSVANSKITGCKDKKKDTGINAVVAAISIAQQGSEAATKNDVDITITATDYQTYQNVSKQLKAAGLKGYDINFHQDQGAQFVTFAAE